MLSLLTSQYKAMKLTNTTRGRLNFDTVQTMCVLPSLINYTVMILIHTNMTNYHYYV